MKHMTGIIAFRSGFEYEILNVYIISEKKIARLLWLKTFEKTGIIKYSRL